MDYSKKILDFNNVIGLDEVKNNLKEYVVMQIKYPQLKEKDLYKDGLYYAAHLELENHIYLRQSNMNYLKNKITLFQ